MQRQQATAAALSHGRRGIPADARAIARLLLDLHPELADARVQATLLESFGRDDAEIAGMWLTVCRAINRMTCPRPGESH